MKQVFGYKSVLDALKAFFINILTLIIPFIPPYISRNIVGFIGFTSFVFLKRRRRAIIGVLKVVKAGTNNSTLKRLALRTLINYANNFSDFLRLYHMDAKKLVTITELKGMENLEKPLRKKKGVILVSAHIGNWEIFSNLIACLGFPLVVIVESAGPGEELYKLFKRYRAHFGTIVLSLEDPSIGFKLRRFLKRGYIIGLVGDRDIAGTGIEVNFFGKKAIFPQGAAFLSLVTKSPIIISFLLRKITRGKKIYYCYAEKAIDFKKGKDKRENIRKLTQIIANRIEREVRKYPDQWFAYPPPWEGEG